MIDEEDQQPLVDTSVLVIVELLCLFLGFGFWYLNSAAQATDAFMSLAAIAFFGALASGAPLYWRFRRHGLDSHPAFTLGVLLPSLLMLISAVSAFLK